MRARHCLLGLALAAPIVAQTVQLRDDPERFAQIVDLRAFVDRTQGDGATVKDQQQVVAGAAAMLRAFARPALGADDAVATVGQRRLVLVGTHAQQDSWNKLLATWRTLGPEAHGIEVQCVCLSAAAAREFAKLCGVDLEQPLPTAVVLKREKESTALREQLLAAAGDVRTEPISIQAVALASNAVVHMADVSYVQDWEPTPKVGNGSSWKQKTGKIATGVRGEMTAAPLPAGGIGVASHLQWACLTRPIPKFKTKAPDGAELEIELPSLTLVPRTETGLVLFPARPYHTAWAWEGSMHVCVRSRADRS
jgi:hypothetical protein